MMFFEINHIKNLIVKEDFLKPYKPSEAEKCAARDDTFLRKIYST